MAGDDDGPAPGESYGEWKKRRSKEWREWYNTAEGERARNDTNREAEEREFEQHARGDKQWEEAMREVLGDDVNQAIKDIKNAPYADPRVKKALEAIRDAKKAQEGGWIFSGNPAKAKKILKANQGHIKYARNQGRKGCWLFTCVMALLALAIAAATTWGGVEVVEALAR